ncbi:hypothetical protein SAMN02744124_00805 [Paenibacillus barengoltzii J12]|uniref:Uncharacterized protein n=1 Tax=Paenibacillus barengoltzii J12 TaxID=935846 RepID=A0ABY1LTM9_9BACL|nr:hypothetical protein SAMN02744124_00805 [Paenibacillus barengoltzii J12]
MVCGLGAGGLGRKKEGRSSYKVHVHLGEFRAAKRACLQPSSGLRMHNTPCFRRNSVAGKRWSAGSLWLQVSRLLLLLLLLLPQSQSLPIVTVTATVTSVTIPAVLLLLIRK